MLHIPASLCLCPPEVGDHDLHQARQVDVMLPAPLLPGERVVKHHGPRVSDVLSRVGAVLYLEVGDPLLDLSVVGQCKHRGCCLLSHFTSSNISSGVKLIACTL